MAKYREVQLIRLALWSKDILSKVQRDALLSLNQANPERFKVTKLAAEILRLERPRIIAQYRADGTCTDLGAMSGACQLCDHPIRYQFGLVNAVTGSQYVVGSECITNYVDASLRPKLSELQVKAREERRSQEHKKLVEEAWGATRPGEGIRDFIKSVAEGYKKYRCLTAKQVAALERIVAQRR